MTAPTEHTPAAAPAAGHTGALHWSTVLGWLHEDGVITAEEAARTRARCSQAESAQHPLVRLASVGVARAADGRPLDLEELTQHLARRAQLPYLRIDPLKVDAGRVGEVMSAPYAERHKVLPVQVTPAEVVVATADPFALGWLPEVERQTRRRVRLVVANPQEIKRYTGEFYALSHSVRAAVRSSAGGTGAANSFEQLVELGQGGGAGGRQPDANDQGIIQLVDWLWQYAFEQRASDIHLEPRREQGVVRFRIDGVLQPVYQVPPAVMNAITARIKLLGRMDVVERRRPQDGRIKTRTPAGEEVEMRLSTLPTAFGEKLVMRIFDPEAAVKDLAALGFAAHDAQRWESLIAQPHGIILVTGPTGSGKTTTLYSTLRRVATEHVNVCTIEDPIERIDPALNQTQVQPQLDFGFAEGVRALMRQDPDIIMIGEIRDLQTAEMAVQSALTGHLVLSTLHTNDAPSAFTRLMELGVPAYLLGATVLGVLAQRLVRTLCPHCKQPGASDATGALLDAIKPWKINGGSYQPYRPTGCEQCRNSGYRGRLGIYELLTVGEELRGQLHAGCDLAALRRQAMADGMRPLRLAGAMRVAEGLTTLEEVVAATPPIS